MPNYFFDSSALIKRYLIEAGTEEVVAMVNGPHRTGVSRLTYVEVIATVVRRAKGGDLENHHASAVLTAFEEDFRTRFVVTEVRGPTLTRAADLVKVHALKSADAIQLACLLAAGSGLVRNDLIFVCSDASLNTAARAEGMTILDPSGG